ncbi:unnamed protein product, partial [Symbiodinium sp. CCMP2456]
MAVRALAAPVLSPRSKVQLPTGPSSSATPLLDMENAEKQKWAKRLKAIVDRAGDHAGHNREPDAGGILSAEERDRLRLLVFTSGAPATMANHIRRFEKFELWAQTMQLAFYPITDDLILKYAMELDTRECGPTVVPSLRTALKLKALEKKIFTERGKPLKEAIAFPIELVQAMEQFVVNPAHAAPARVFLWWVLCMIFASLRFDDAIHVKPHEIEVLPEGLFGISWQTKTERKRRGTKFMVPDIAFSKAAWFKVGLDLFNLQFPLVERDFWVPELDTKEQWRATPPDYARSLQWLHHLVW